MVEIPGLNHLSVGHSACWPRLSQLMKPMKPVYSQVCPLHLAERT